jgi:hypothetical protein
MALIFIRRPYDRTPRANIIWGAPSKLSGHERRAAAIEGQIEPVTPQTKT